MNSFLFETLYWHNMTESIKKTGAEATKPVAPAVRPAMAEGNPVFRMMGIEYQPCSIWRLM